MRHTIAYTPAHRYAHTNQTLDFQTSFQIPGFANCQHKLKFPQVLKQSYYISSWRPCYSSSALLWSVWVPLKPQLWRPDMTLHWHIHGSSRSQSPLRGRTLDFEWCGLFWIDYGNGSGQGSFQVHEASRKGWRTQRTRTIIRAPQSLRTGNFETCQSIHCPCNRPINTFLRIFQP
jgi:hypothetical protein